MEKDFKKIQNSGFDDLSMWPTVLVDDLSSENKEIFKRRRAAVQDYFKDKATVNLICEKYKLKRSNFYRLLARCLEIHSDGKIYGYRALIPNQRVKRTTHAPFEGLLNRYPMLEEELKRDFFNAYKKNEVREKNINIKNIHKRFVRNCVNVGIDLNEYPLNTSSKALKSVQRFLTSLADKHFISVTSRYGDDAVMVAKNTGRNYSDFESTTPIRPFERVEFDGHKIDVSLAIIFKTPEGDEIVDTINRIWILSIIDVATRCILGYHLCLQKEYSSDDVLMCIRNAIKPWEPKQLTIPKLVYKEHSGFPSFLIDAAKYGIWDELCYDNAKANLAIIVQEKLTEFVGCSINMGPVATPVRRPHIERFFQTLEINGFQRIVSTTGNSTKDPRRRKGSEQIAVKYQISSEHIEEIADVIIAEYNITPHNGLSGLTPIEVMKQRIEKGMHIDTLAEDKRSEFLFFTTKFKRTIRGNLNKGIRPSVFFEGVKYKNDIIAHTPSLIGKTVTLLVNVDDIRFLKVYLENGSELGILSAIGKWGVRPHSLRERKAINKLINSREIEIPTGEDPIEIYHNFLKTNASSKNVRNKLASFEKNQSSKKKRYEITADEVPEQKEKKSKPKKVEAEREKVKVKLRKTLQF
ncbi:hypothetical protein MKY29_09640 [Psychrobacillus sp. FSL K6-2365]|uniref:hypothetical protein n=1 Tax=Psychrobacillus sp. FSL K6-2365 TaxID=2921546 RepID=UPI0030F69A16